MPPDETIETLRNEVGGLRARVAQLKTDLGQRRSDSYTVVVLRETIDKLIAGIEADDRYRQKPALVDVNAPLALIQTDLEGRMTVLKHLRQIAWRDHASDMFPDRPKT